MTATASATSSRPRAPQRTASTLLGGKACDLLLEKRVEQKVKQGKADTFRNRLHIAGTAAPSNRPPCIPDSVVRQRAGEDMAIDEEKKQEKLEKDRMEDLGGAGVYSVDLWRKAILEDTTWKYDVVPEIMDGHNVADFVDPDIDRRLAELEREEALLLEEEKVRDDDTVLTTARKTMRILEQAHSRIAQKKLTSRLAKSRNGRPVLRKKGNKVEDVVEELTSKGIDSSKVRGRSVSRKRPEQSLLGKRKRAASTGEESVREGSVAGTRAASAASARSKSRMRGLPSEEAAEKAEKVRRKRMRYMEKLGKKGEADRHIPDLKPKHLYSGKRGIGKTDRR